LIWCTSFFEQSTNEKYQEAYLKRARENIFLAMELGKLSYCDILQMPVNRLEEYLTWKIRNDQEREKNKADSLGKIKI